MESTNNYMETDLGNVSPNPKGTYDNETAYEYLDLVEYQGGSYLCTVDIDKKVKGISPVAGQNSETWQLVALPGTSTEEYVAKHTEVIEKAKQVETSRAAVELCKQEVESAQADVEQMRQDTQQVAQNASDANTEAQQAAQQAEASRSAAQTSEQNAAASRNLANTYKEAAETAKSAAETAAQNASESKTAAETAAQNAAQSKADIDSIKAGIEEAAKGENVLQIKKNMNDIDSLKEDLGNKITKFYASNEGKNHLADSDNGKIMDMMIYGKSEQKHYKGINLLPPDTKPKEYVEVSIPKDSPVFLVTDGTLSNGGNLKFFNEDKTKSVWLGIDSGTTSAKKSLTIDAKYVQNLMNASFDLSKICLGVGSEPIYEPYTGGIPSPSPDYPQEIKSVVNPTVKVTNEDGLKVQSVTLNNITLNAIPVSSGGNVTINGQQYVADYVDVKRGKIVKCIEKYRISSGLKWIYEPSENDRFGAYELNININPNFGGNTLFTHYQNKPNGTGGFITPGNIRLHNFQGFTDVTNFKEWLDKNESYAYFVKNTLEEIDLTTEEIQIFKELATYYPTTNISVNSEQLDGYTVFNYPISMANGWNYVKQQLNDNRDYIYDMDLQSAETYVNSEYAVALTELEVM